MKRPVVIVFSVIVAVVIDWFQARQAWYAFSYFGAEAWAPIATHSGLQLAHSLLPGFLVGALLAARQIALGALTSAAGGVASYVFLLHYTAGEVPSAVSVTVHGLALTIYGAAGAALGAAVRGHITRGGRHGVV